MKKASKSVAVPQNHLDLESMSMDDMMKSIAAMVDSRKSEKDWKKRAGETSVLRHPEEHIALPNTMPLLVAANITRAMAEQDEQIINFHRQIPGFPLDAALALNNVLTRLYGYVTTSEVRTMFGTIKPKTITVKVGPTGQTIRIPWGRLNLHYFSSEEYLDTGFGLTSEGLPAFEIVGNIKRANEGAMIRIMDMVEELLKTHSIYQGHAIQLHDLSWRNGSRRFTPDDSPTYFDTGITLDDVILPEASARVLRAEIIRRITDTEELEEMGISIGFGALFTGTFGTGKTITASALATECVRNGWTFIYLKEPKRGDIEYAMSLAELYSKGDKGVVLFVEDIDLLLSPDRTSDAGSNPLINALDNIGNKHSRVITIFTTNNPLDINIAVRRAGRIGLYLEFERPTGEEALRFIRMYANGELDPESDVTELHEELDTMRMTPAFLNQVVSRARLLAYDEGRRGHLTADDILHSLVVSRQHIKYAEEQQVEEEPTMDDLFKQVVKETIVEQLGDKVPRAMELILRNL